MQEKSLTEDLVQAKTLMQRQDGSTYQGLLLDAAQKLAKRHKLSLYQVEEAALQQDILPQRFCRNQKSITTGQQLKLSQARIAIVGLGGLGGNVVELLARVGVGNFTLIDGDLFDESNLNRQLLAESGTLGKAKAEAARERILAINPAARLTVYQQWFNRENGEQLLAGCDLALDCLDSIGTRFLLENSCRSSEIPLISAAIGGSMGQVTVILPEDKGLEAIYGDPQNCADKGIEKTLGTPAPTVSAVASIQAAETVKLLLTGKAPLQGRLLLYDLADYSIEIMTL